MYDGFMNRLVALLAVSSLAPFGFGQSFSDGGNLAVTLPKDAKITMELDARDDDLLALIKTLLKFDPGDSSSSPTKVSIPGAGGGVSMNIGDISSVIKYIHHVHVVTYEGGGGADGLAFQEEVFRKQGMQRMFFSGESSFSVMRSAGMGPMAFISATDDSVTVARTDGMVDLRALGQLGVRALSSMAANPQAKPGTVSIEKKIDAKPATKAVPAKTVKATAKPVTKTSKSTVKKTGGN